MTHYSLLKKSLVSACGLLLFPCTLLSQSILFPLKNDTLYAGGEYQLKYNGFSREHKQLHIELYNQDTPVNTLTKTRNRKYFIWTVPRDIKAGVAYRIKISGNAGSNAFCFSEPFFIHKPILIIQAPKANDTWGRSGGKASYSINWAQKGNAGDKVVIGLFRRGYNVWKQGIESQNDGLFMVTISDSIKIKGGTGYTVSIKSVDDPGIYAISQPFTINNFGYNYKSLEDIPLVWMVPESKTITNLISAQYFKANRLIFNVLKFKDMRKDTALIGENLESSYKTRRVTINEPVSDWCCEYLTELMKACGLIVGPAGYNFSIIGEIDRFFVTETATYRAEIGITFYVITPDGAPVWSKRISAEADNWGSSYKATNYYECITSAYITVFTSFFNDPSFKSALTQQ